MGIQQSQKHKAPNVQNATRFSKGRRCILCMRRIADCNGSGCCVICYRDRGTEVKNHVNLRKALEDEQEIFVYPNALD